MEAPTEYIEAINAVIQYHKNNGYWADYPFQIYQTLTIDTTSCNYYLANSDYYFTYIDTITYPFFRRIEMGKRYDYLAINKILYKKWSLPTDSTLYKMPVRILEEKKIPKHKYGYMIYPEGTFCFSPLIPRNKKNRYSLWLTIKRDRDPPFYDFIVEKIDGKFVVLGQTNDDFCSALISTDYIKKLK